MNIMSRNFIVLVHLFNPLFVSLNKIGVKSAVILGDSPFEIKCCIQEINSTWGFIFKKSLQKTEHQMAWLKTKKVMRKLFSLDDSQKVSWLKVNAD